MIGPPSVAPNWFRLNAGLPPGGVNKLRASKTWLRRNSKALPWRTLVPDFVVTTTCPPDDRPYSAEYIPVCTLNSSILSTEGRNEGAFIESLLLSMPLTVKLFEVSLDPDTLNPPR